MRIGHEERESGADGVAQWGACYNATLRVLIDWDAVYSVAGPMLRCATLATLADFAGALDRSVPILTCDPPAT